MDNELLDLLAGGFAQSLSAAEIGGVGLDQNGIQLVLPSNMAEAVAELGATVVPVGRLRELLRLRGGLSWFG
jgi:hypothetical protein